ncbi:hypothetical protein M433DRAFT_5720 [Acidomyces richmondensis BFW]|nr:MAG: hypothetical protein FE78DRAFT_66252 [Acidomyces sp. 'richmondensis']KYG44128.1 hypothetical protein M433DRAFT_5720 [Acidomyces richmondensis BFW]
MNLFSVLLAWFSFATVHSAVIPNAPLLPKRQGSISASTITSDIYAISSAIYKLRSDVREYNGGIVAYTSIPKDFADIQGAMRKAWDDCGRRGWNFTVAESGAIVQYLSTSIGNDIPACISELQAKQPQFQSSGQSNFVKGNLLWMQWDFNSFTSMLSSKLTGDLFNKDATVGKINSAIQGGTNSFSA